MPSIDIDLNKLSDDELEAYVKLLKAIQQQKGVKTGSIEAEI